jgi:type 2 lantibiotic biosynthesis protein LanM
MIQPPPPAPSPVPPELGWFAAPVAVWAAPFRSRLEQRLSAIPGLADAERQAVAEASHRVQLSSLQRKLTRLLLLEMRAGALSGELPGTDGRQRWAAFLERAGSPDFLTRLETRYPGLGRRITDTATQQVDAAEELAGRLAADRALLSGLLGTGAGELRAVHLGAGDPHQGGRSVARLVLAGGTVMYKPRCLRVDAALDEVLARLWDLAGAPSGPRPRTPLTLARTGYGWSEYLPHRYCADEAELACFYRSLGHWLALMRLTGGTDLHAENIIAHGPRPVVVDGECLFTEDVAPPHPSGRGDAVDRSAAVIRRTVLRTGILPVRMEGYALAGIDLSAAGALPGQQPLIPVPAVVDGGSDTARLEVRYTDPEPTGNHPWPHAVLERHWDRVLNGFRELTSHLRAADARGELTPLLAPFLGCRVRRLRRGTQAYMEIGRMLWHPASLHRPDEARERARDILLRHARALPGAPEDPETIETEIDDLILGDVPVFTRVVDAATVSRSVADWRAADLPLEESTIQGALVGAYLNERSLPPRRQAELAEPRTDELEARRRAAAAGIARMLCDKAVRGDDGTATWISPVLLDIGWAVRPLTAELYTGQGGVALALAAYVHQERQGRADPVPEAAEVLRGALRVLAATEDTVPTRGAGGYTGIASQVWTWTALHGLSGDAEQLHRAGLRAAALTPEVIEEDTALDVLGGVAGTIVPLLNLAELTGEDRWLASAARAGRRLADTALLDDRGARWSTALFAEGIGGFAHGATGMGWALHRLALSDAGTAAERRRWQELADRALAFEDSLWNPEARNWHDARLGTEVEFGTAWCHGSAGIGLAAVDLYHRTGDRAHLRSARRAVAATLAEGFGWSHTLCHGDLGLADLVTHCRELPAQAGGRVPAPGLPGPAEVLARLITDLEHRGPVGGLAREAFSPGLLPGVSGVLHTLLRLGDAPRTAAPDTPLLLTAPARP